MSIQDREALASLAARYKILIVADEVYHLLDWTSSSSWTKNGNHTSTIPGTSSSNSFLSNISQKILPSSSVVVNPPSIFASPSMMSQRSFSASQQLQSSQNKNRRPARMAVIGKYEAYPVLLESNKQQQLSAFSIIVNYMVAVLQYPPLPKYFVPVYDVDGLKDHRKTFKD
jgi:hypothetical protein